MGQPFDPNKAVLLGKMVLAAYDMYEHPGPDPLRPPPSTLIPPEYELSAWIQMSDFILHDKLPKFYGIVVHEVANPDSRIIAIRGTEGIVEWMDDAFAIPVSFHQVHSAGRVAGGFDKIYSTMRVVKHRAPKALVEGAPAPAMPAEFTGSFADQLDQLAESGEAERGLAPRAKDLAPRLRPTEVAGHSLGAALTTLFAMENDSKRRFQLSTLYTFASPRVGTMEFVHAFNRLPLDSWRIFNSRDIVPKLPLHIPIFFDYAHVDSPYEVDSSKFAKNNPICWHAMQTYLHGIDGTYPLRPECAV